MCKVSDKLLLCTCKAENIDSLKNYWVFYRRNKNKNLFIVGSMIIPYAQEENIEKYNEGTLLRLMNTPSTFDVDLKPKAGDRIQLHFTVNDEQFMNYGFEYKRSKWILHAYNQFEWDEKYDESKHGKIVNALQSKTKNRTTKYNDLEITSSTESVLDENEKRLMELINENAPKTESEKRLIQQIKEIEKKGRIIDIPPSGF